MVLWVVWVVALFDRVSGVKQGEDDESLIASIIFYNIVKIGI